MTAHRLPYRADIDGLRAVAVLVVLCYHAGLGIPGGYVGVDVFFVISGYLIGGLILKGLEHGTFTLAEFWERRIRRIVPALLPVAVATIVAGWCICIPDDCVALGKSVIALALFSSNILFSMQVGYFADPAEDKPLLHTWSLAVEEQFYLVVPLFFAFFARRNQLRTGFGLLWIVSLVSFALCVHGARYSPGAFYLLPQRAWELLVGVLLARHAATQKESPPVVREAVAALGLLAILLPCALYDNMTRFPGIAALPPVMGAAMLIWSGESQSRLPFVSRLLCFRPLVFVGTISYSLYIWHWPLLVFAQYRSPMPLSLIERMLVMVASFAIAVLSWRFVERPFRNRTVAPSPRQLFRFSTAAIAATLVAGASLYVAPHLLEQSEQVKLFAQTGSNDVRFARNLRAEDVPANLIPLGRAGARPEILVWGDSHAGAILPAIDAACHEANISACAATRLGTPPILDYAFSGNHRSLEADRDFNTAVLEYVRTSNIRTVIMIGYWKKYARDDDEKAASGILQTVDQLRAAGISVYFMKDVPEFAFRVPRYLVRYSRSGGDINTLGMELADYEAGNDFEEAILPKLKQRGVNILDPIPYLIAEGTPAAILPFDAEGSYYTDSNHLSKHGALTVKPMFHMVARPVYQTAQEERTLH